MIFNRTTEVTQPIYLEVGQTVYVLIDRRVQAVQVVDVVGLSVVKYRHGEVEGSTQNIYFTEQEAENAAKAN